MLANILLTLRPVELQQNAPFPSGQHIRAAFYNLLADINETLALELHEDSGPQAFALSPLIGKLSWSGRPEPITAPACKLRISTLTAPLLQAVLTSLGRKVADSKNMRIDRTEFSITGYSLEDPWNANVPSEYGALLSSKPLPELKFAFKTPTAFKQGKLNLPLPVPRLMFQSYLSRWNRFAPAELAISEDLLPAVEKSVMVSSHSISTRMIDMGNLKMVGFLGSCNLEVDGSLSEEVRRQITALARYAVYSGTGAKTTIGMGQTHLSGTEASNARRRHAR
ncbi:MAG: CRISPR system precrRNA processing endoribonuclease RAMP protein Cas6 [Armatimonadota bacterium]